MRWFLLVSLASCVTSPPPKVSLDDAPDQEAPDVVTTLDTAPDCALVTYFADVDGDGFGDPNNTRRACELPEGYVEDSGDCDDMSDAIRPGADETCNGLDDDCDRDIDESFQDLTGDDVPDCGRTQIWCEDFSGPFSWSSFGPGSWAVQGGVLREDRAGYYSTVSFPPQNVGYFEHFGIEVDTAFTGSLNDFAGLAWRVNETQESYVAVRWDDPADDYQRHDPPGFLEIARCLLEECVPEYQQAVPDVVWTSQGDFVRWGVEVDGDRLIVRWGGTVVLDTVPPTTTSIAGPGVVGLYSNDNDGGVLYDNVCVWVEQ